MNETLPQPPPDAPMPPPTEAALRSQRRRNWIVGVGTLSVIFVGVLSLPFWIHTDKSADLTEAISNCRQMGLALMEFEADYGSFPDDSTRQLVQERIPGNTIAMGTASSNDYFRQLIAAGISTSEMMFYAKTSGTHKPDNVTSGIAALAKGECAFAYVIGHSTKSDPKTPVVLFPLAKGKLLFETSNKHLHGKVVVMFADNSFTSYPLDKSGHVFINGKDLFDPSQPFWGGKAPVVKWPE